MEALLNNIPVSYQLYKALSIVCVVLAALCALFVIVVVMIQPSNSSGISALGGASETFYGKNKSKTIESKLRKLTVVCIVIMTVLMVCYYLMEVLLKVGA